MFYLIGGIIVGALAYYFLVLRPRNRQLGERIAAAQAAQAELKAPREPIKLVLPDDTDEVYARLKTTAETYERANEANVPQPERAASATVRPTQVDGPSLQQQRLAREAEVRAQEQTRQREREDQRRDQEQGEEDERRRAAASTTSAADYSASLHTSPPSPSDSDSGTSFGGGSFGGGGGGSSWGGSDSGSSSSDSSSSDSGGGDGGGSSD